MIIKLPTDKTNVVNVSNNESVYVIQVFKLLKGRNKPEVNTAIKK